MKKDTKKAESVKQATADKTKTSLTVKSTVKAGPGIGVGRPFP